MRSVHLQQDITVQKSWLLIAPLHDTTLLVGTRKKQRYGNLFSSILCNQNHILHQLMPPEKTTGYNLQKRSHNLTIL